LTAIRPEQAGQRNESIKHEEFRKYEEKEIRLCQPASGAELPF